MSSYDMLAPKPDHVPAELVVDYDLFGPVRAEDEYQTRMAHFLQSGPEIIWTPRNGGHWVFTRAEDIDRGQRDESLFSTRQISLPPVETPAPLVPLEADGAEHIAYRSVLQPVFAPQAIIGMTDAIRDLTIQLIDGFKDRGHCEFVSEFAAILPVAMFMKLADVPDSDRADLLAWAETIIHPKSEQDRHWGYGLLTAYIERLMIERADGVGTDLVSRVMQGEVFGRAMTHSERVGMLLVTFNGGLDTVMSAMGFIASYLARHPEQRRRLVDEPAKIPAAIEELMRYFGATGTARIVQDDIDYKGVRMKKGDRVFVQAMVHGRDPRRFPDPDVVDFDRKDKRHATFSQGKHRCIGALLARQELRIFLEEWLKRIPDFAVDPDRPQLIETGMVNTVRRLDLVWSPAQAGPA